MIDQKKSLTIGQEKSLIKKILPHLAAIGCFLIITFVYFSPEFQGKALMQGDVQQYWGMSHELLEYYENEGEASVWTGSMFSGMPAYQIGIFRSNPNLLNYVEYPLKALGSKTAGAVFTGMLMAYIMFIVLGFGIIPSILGAIAFSLSSYNIIIIEAGHVTKAWAIAYMPLIVAGLMVMFRKRYLLGGVLMVLGLTLQIKSNHLQVTYYTGLLCIIIYLVYLYQNIREKDFKGIAKSAAILSVAVILAFASNIFSFYSNYEMAEESIRGTSELSQPTQTEKQSSGLDIEYAFRWSYEKSETFTLLIPNLFGGVTTAFDKNSDSYKGLIGRYQSGQLSEQETNGLYQRMTHYWGDQPFTSGPVYFGAIICFLFVLGMIIVKDKMKWVFFVASVFFIFLSWGRHFDILNDWLFYHLPYYNKFRAVSMALVIPALTMLIVAVWGVKEFFSGDVEKKKLYNALYWAAGTTAGICLIFGLAPTLFFDFIKESDQELVPHYTWFFESLANDRMALFTSDAWRSFIFIVLAAAVLWISTKVKMEKKTTMAFTLVLTVLVLVDLWSVDKRYLNNDKFAKTPKPEQLFPKSNADNFMLQDKSPSFRVLNMSDPSNIAAAFNEATTAYYHKAIGGYHAAKLKRYQELIDYRLLPEMSRFAASFNTQNIDSIFLSLKDATALNMLNAKYIVLRPEQAPLENPYRLGNAWFVSEYFLVNNADEEIGALNTLNPATQAVIDKRFEAELSGFKITPDSTASIVMIQYKPDWVKYKSSAQSEQLAIFSEVYYANGWEAYIDGKPVSHFRTNWTLRGLRIPAGEHDVEFRFIAHDYNLSCTISTVSSGLLILLLLGALIFPFVRKKKPENE